MGSLSLLVRSLVRTYYEANIGFFMVVLYLAFGLMRSTEHIAIATSISTSLPLTLGTMLLWALYWSKAYGFLFKTINKSKYTLLRQLSLHPIKKQLIWLNFVVFLIGTPAWAYAVFIAVFNFAHHTFGLFLLMVSFLLLTNVIITIALIKSLAGVLKEPNLSLWHRVISKRFTLPFNLWYPRYLFVHQPMLIFLSKLGSITILAGSFYLFTTDSYDWRLLAVGVLFSLMLNSMLVHNLYEFLLKNSWLQNLPRKKSQIMLSALFIIVILFIPEIAFILIKLPTEISFLEALGLLFFNVSVAYALLASLFKFPILKEDYAKRVFYVLIAMIFLIIYSVPLVLFNMLITLFSLLVFSKFYQLMLDQ